MGQTSVIELRSVSAAQDGAEGHRIGFTEKLALEPSSQQGWGQRSRPWPPR
jgi:hypothetical protein